MVCEAEVRPVQGSTVTFEKERSLEVGTAKTFVVGPLEVRVLPLSHTVNPNQTFM